MQKKKIIILSSFLLGVTTFSAIWGYKQSKQLSHRSPTDDALLALIKNDHKAFDAFITSGGKVHDLLPLIDGKTYSVAQGIAYFERTSFAKYLNSKKINYLTQDEKKDFDIMTISIAKNSPELLKQLGQENPNYSLAYGNKGWTLIHMASAQCSFRLMEILEKEGKLSWNLKAKDGSTPLTLAAEYDCLPILSYWKKSGADFKLKDGRGMSALAIIKEKKDAAFMAFADSFESRKIVSVGVVANVEPNFYKKRQIPKDQIVDHAAMIEPADRPLEASETSEFSEFAD